MSKRRSLLLAVKQSTYATNSEIRTPLVTLKNLDRWAATWVTDSLWPEKANIDVSQYRTLESVIMAGIAQIEEQSEWSLTVHSDYGFSVIIRELMRADLDGDNNEEILIFVLAFAQQGTYRAGIGGIGRNVTEMLLAKRHKVRALVRREDERAEDLRRLGAEVMLGDLTDLASMHSAIEGCSRVYFGMSISANYLEARS